MSIRSLASAVINCLLLVGSRQRSCRSVVLDTHLEFLDPLIDGVYICAQVPPLQLSQLLLCPAKPRLHSLQVRGQLLPQQQVFVGVMGLSLDDLPALDHTYGGKNIPHQRETAPSRTSNGTSSCSLFTKRHSAQDKKQV